MNMIQVGTKVRWTSSNTLKEGIVTHVVPVGKVPTQIGVPRLDNSGLPRQMESYVVRGQHVFRGKAEGRKANYWPLVSLLEVVHDEQSSEAALLLALRTVATFPITDPKNQDAVNMQMIARDAIKLTGANP